MKNKILLTDIVEQMAALPGIPKGGAEEFVKVLLSTIEDSLMNGEVVKIKGFGTFKPQWTAPRKSVDINSGKEIVISGYNRVIFSPDTLLKDMVNEPFAHLETVVLDEGNESVSQDINNEEISDNQRIFEEKVTEIKSILSEIGALSEETTPASVTILPTEPVNTHLVDEVDDFQDNFDDTIEETEISEDITPLIEEGVIDDSVVTVSLTREQETVENTVSEKVFVATQSEEKEDEKAVISNAFLLQNDEAFEAVILPNVEEKEVESEEEIAAWNPDDFNIVRDLSQKKAKIVSDIEIETGVKLVSEMEEEAPRTVGVTEEESEEKIEEKADEAKSVAEETTEISMDNGIIEEIEIPDYTDTALSPESKTAPSREGTADEILDEEISDQDGITKISEIETVLEPETKTINDLYSNGNEPKTNGNDESDWLAEFETELDNEGEFVEVPTESGMTEETATSFESSGLISEERAIEETKDDADTPTKTVETEDAEEADALVTESGISLSIEDGDDDNKSGFWKWGLAGSFIAVFCLAIWFFYPELNKIYKHYVTGEDEFFFEKNENEELSPEIPAVVLPDSIADTDSVSVVNANGDSVEVDTVDTVSSATSVAEEQLDTEVEQRLSLQELFDKKREYTDYITTVTFKRGSQLNRLAQEHLGHPYFWVYIYEANKDVIRDPDNVPLNAKIKIPVVDKALLDVNNRECLNYALKLSEIYLQ